MTKKYARFLSAFFCATLTLGFTANALTPDGEPDIRGVVSALVFGRARIGDLMRLGRDSNAAFAVLARCRQCLGVGLGFPPPPSANP